MRDKGGSEKLFEKNVKDCYFYDLFSMAPLSVKIDLFVRIGLFRRLIFIQFYIRHEIVPIDFVRQYQFAKKNTCWNGF